MSHSRSHLQHRVSRPHRLCRLLGSSPLHFLLMGLSLRQRPSTVAVHAHLCPLTAPGGVVEPPPGPAESTGQPLTPDLHHAPTRVWGDWKDSGALAVADTLPDDVDADAMLRLSSQLGQAGSQADMSDLHASLGPPGASAAMQDGGYGSMPSFDSSVGGQDNPCRSHSMRSLQKALLAAQLRLRRPARQGQCLQQQVLSRLLPLPWPPRLWGKPRLRLGWMPAQRSHQLLQSLHVLSRSTTVSWCNSPQKRWPCMTAFGRSTSAQTVARPCPRLYPMHHRLQLRPRQPTLWLNIRCRQPCLLGLLGFCQQP